MCDQKPWIMSTEHTSKKWMPPEKKRIWISVSQFTSTYISRWIKTFILQTMIKTKNFTIKDMSQTIPGQFLQFPLTVASGFNLSRPIESILIYIARTILHVWWMYSIYYSIHILHYCYHVTQLGIHLYEETVQQWNSFYGMFQSYSFIPMKSKFQKLVRDDENCSPIHLDSTRIGKLTYSINNSSWGLCLKHVIFAVFWYTHIFVLLWP